MPKPSKKAVVQKKQIAPIWLWVILAAGVALIAFVVIDAVSRNSSTPPVAPLATDGPALQVDKENVDFGNVTLGQTVEAKFEVTNVGDQPLHFTQKPYVEVIEGC